MLVLTDELDRLTPSVASVYDDDAEPDVVTTSAYFRSMPILIHTCQPFQFRWNHSDFGTIIPYYEYFIKICIKCQFF